MTTMSFAGHQFPPAIIRHAVWLYVRLTLSFEDFLADRGKDVSYETVRRWLLKFGPLFANLNCLPPSSRPATISSTCAPCTQVGRFKIIPTLNAYLA
jgi:transposase-like protein